VAYTRATTVAGTLDDRYNLELWKMRQVAAGLAARPDLVALACSQAGDKTVMNRICGDAMDASASGAAANLGTAVHGFVEQINRGIEPVSVPETVARDLAAYRKAMEAWDVLHAERFLVLDEYKIAGTADMIMVERDTGRVVISDLKTGKGAITYGQGAIAAQLAIYSRGVIYHADTGDREPVTVDQDVAIVVHLPAGEGRCSLFEVDIAAGWQAVEHSMWTRDWRKQRNLFTPYTVAAHQAWEDETSPAAPKPARPPNWIGEAEAAPTVVELEAVYRAAVAAGADTSALIPVCAARKAELTAA
jgi:hypothetical protein